VKPRNPFVEAARGRRAGPMHDRRAGRGGTHNEQRELLADLEDDSGRRVAITGNRGITTDDEAVVRARVRELALDPTVAVLFFGGARGADTVALDAALAARKGGRPRLVVVLPDTLEAQPRDTWATTRRADERLELGRPIRAEDRWRAYHLRNRRLVEEATELLAFWNGEPRSGTASTINLARKRGIEVELVRVEGGDGGES
jgi:predicted Rossmann fold nucleotide-binding protein DprA/Smf involved in DNA uptake